MAVSSKVHARGACAAVLAAWACLVAASLPAAQPKQAGAGGGGAPSVKRSGRTSKPPAAWKSYRPGKPDAAFRFKKTRRPGREFIRCVAGPETVSDSVALFKKFLGDEALYASYADPGTPFFNAELRGRLLARISDWLGTRYVRGGFGKRGVDCSNFTANVVRDSLGARDFPRSPAEQAKVVEPVSRQGDLRFGDLVFFKGINARANRIGHVGIYVGNGVFAHSTNHRGVIYSHLSESYYTARYKGAGRLPVWFFPPLTDTAPNGSDAKIADMDLPRAPAGPGGTKPAE